MSRYLEEDDYKKMLRGAKKLLKEKQTQLTSLEQTYAALTEKPSFTSASNQIVYGEDYLDASPTRPVVKVPAGSTAAMLAEEAKDALAARASTATNPLLNDPYYIRDPKTGLSPAQVEANKAVAEAAAATGMQVTPGVTGPQATADRVSTTPVKTSVTDTEFPKAGTILRYRPGRAGFRIPVIADGKGGEYDGSEEKDPAFSPDGDGSGGFEFIEYEYSKDFKKRRAKSFNKKTGQFSYGEWEDAPMSKEDYDAEQAKKIAEERALNEKRDAFALIEATMRSYGFTESELKELIDYIQTGLLNPALGANQMVLQLRQLASYKARFAGNEERRARGLNALDESDYLRQENAYSETFRQNGLGRFVTRGQFANLIGNDISNTELSKRVNLGVNRLQNADPAILAQLRKYYNINDSDVIAYILNPKEVLPELEAKTTQAEIGATAAQYGLNADLARAKELQQYGVNLDEARMGYSKIAERLPRATTLADIYKQAGIDYTQTTAEQEEFKGLASAKRARERLKELEIGSFTGQSGLGKTSLNRPSGGRI